MILLILFSLFLIYLFDLLYWSRRNLPPGPTPYPLIGNLNLMTEEVQPGYKLYERLTKKYGPVYTFWTANMPMVHVTDWNLIKQHFIKDGASFVGRPEYPLSMELRKGPLGIVEAHGERWQKQRRFALHVLRDFGLGRNLMEEKVIGEVRAMLDRIRESPEDVDMQNVFDVSVGSIVNAILFGYRYDASNIDEFLTLKRRIDTHFKISMKTISGLISVYPWLGSLPVFSWYKKIAVNNMGGLMEEFRKKAIEKMKTIDYESEEFSDLVEAFLKERKRHEHEENHGGFEMEQLDNVCFDLWVAGMETTSNTLFWSLLYVLRNPEVRRKVYKELDDVVGSDRIITTSDRNQLNYINATINETQRLANLLPQNVARAASTDVTVSGYRIPKNTVIIPQISMVLYDPEIFPDPYEFRPERFLETDGSLKKIEEFVPFSIGKRQCLGEGLARMELFLFFANVFNQFDISFHSSNPSPTIGKEFGITMKANNFRVVMTERH